MNLNIYAILSIIIAFLSIFISLRTLNSLRKLNEYVNNILNAKQRIRFRETGCTVSIHSGYVGEGFLYFNDCVTYRCKYCLKDITTLVGCGAYTVEITLYIDNVSLISGRLTIHESSTTEFAINEWLRKSYNTSYCAQSIIDKIYEASE